ncbi:MAG: hypothetical protein JHC31_09095 [Sulfurihydrogenibium sp.]|jgi:hypothetical protein|nr:hypothetical protein [Sulfurihydrogenibium sp.]
MKRKTKKKAEFVQNFKNMSSAFVIKNRNDTKRLFRKITLDEISIPGYKVQVNFLAPELDAYDLRVLIFLLANVNMNKEELEVLEALEDNSIELVRKLEFKLEPSQRSDFSKIVKYETNWKNILSQLGLSYQTKNINKVKESLEYLQSSSVKLIIKEEETGKTVLELSSNLLMFQANILPEDKRNNKVILVFNPLFYLVAFGKTILKSTVNIDVFLKLFRIDANMTVVYYALCDKVDFGKEREFTIEELELACYGNIAKDKSTKSRRKKFLLKTLEEIEKLSSGSFVITITEKEKIKVKRIPDRKIQKMQKLNK